MKKVVAVVAIILFFLLLLGALLFKLLKPSTTTNPAPAVQYPVATNAIGSTEQDPQQFAKSFYEWYLLNGVRNPDFPYVDNRDEILKPWLTSEFISSWDQKQSDFDVDPVLLGIDDKTKASASITTNIVSQSIRSSTVHVVIGSGDSRYGYNVDLVQSSGDGTWKISSVTYAGP